MNLYTVHIGRKGSPRIQQEVYADSSFAAISGMLCLADEGERVEAFTEAQRIAGDLENNFTKAHRRAAANDYRALCLDVDALRLQGAI